jgi:hypothetical protein
MLPVNVSEFFGLMAKICILQALEPKLPIGLKKKKKQKNSIFKAMF